MDYLYSLFGKDSIIYYKNERVGRVNTTYSYPWKKGGALLHEDSILP